MKSRLQDLHCDIGTYTLSARLSVYGVTACWHSENSPGRHLTLAGLSIVFIVIGTVGCMMGHYGLLPEGLAILPFAL